MNIPKKTGALGRFLRRSALLAVTIVLLLLIGTYTLLGTIFHGPSPIARDALTLSMMEDPMTQWIPGLFLDDGLISQICEQGAMPYA